MSLQTNNDSPMACALEIIWSINSSFMNYSISALCFSNLSLLTSFWGFITKAILASTFWPFLLSIRNFFCSTSFFFAISSLVILVTFFFNASFASFSLSSLAFYALAGSSFLDPTALISAPNFSNSLFRCLQYYLAKNPLTCFWIKITASLI